jgi:hypothetical protein
MIKKILLGLFVVLVAIQFIRPARNVSTAPGPQDLSAKHPVPAPVQGLLQRACYDCHSNNTHYPWYAEVQPVGWWLNQHVQDGRRHLDFSTFGTYTAKRAGKKAEEIADEVEHREMPLKSYTWMHPESRLTAEEIKLLVDWANGLRDQIAAP